MLTADLEREIQAFENKCYMWMFGISYKELKTIGYVWQQVSILAARQELVLSTVKRCMFSWFGHVCCHDMLQQEAHHKVGLGETPHRFNLKRFTREI